MLCLAFCIIIGFSISASAQQSSSIPSWVKHTAKWWHENSIGDDEFVKGIQYLIKQKIIKISDTQQGSQSMQHIPLWVKNIAGFWADGKTSDGEFTKSIEYLVEAGIIQIEKGSTQTNIPTTSISPILTTLQQTPNPNSTVSSNTQCSSDVPTVFCVHEHPEFYGINNNVTVTGKLVSLDYNPPIENLTKEHYLDPYSYYLGFISLIISDGKGSLRGSISMKGEIHDKIIQYVSTLHTGDTVTVNGGIYQDWKVCGVRVGFIVGCYGNVGSLEPINSINGVDANSFILPWDIPEEKKPKWFVGKGLTQGEFFKYAISHGTILRGNLSQTDSTNITILFNAKNSSNTWTVDLASETDNKRVDLGKCKLDIHETDFLCSQYLQSEPLKYAEQTVLYLGKYAYEPSPKPLYPLMSNWAKITDFDAPYHWLDVFYGKKETITGAVYNATIVGWHGTMSSDYNTQFTIVDNFPFPTEGRIYKIDETGPDWHGEYYDFKLVDTNWNKFSAPMS